jgi:aryl-alcohol dehydrogenase-like predicted oxidoreductase
MNHRHLGRCGLRIAPLVLGTDNFGNPTPEADAQAIVAAALDAGINCIDTADLYAAGESERMLGRILQTLGARDRVILASKCYYPTSANPNDRGNSRYHIMRACEASLRRLQTDVIDLYQLHRPDFEVPLDETLRALDDLVRQGKVRYIGSSTAPAWHIMEALMVSELRGYVRFVSEQSPYNLLDRRIENELLPMVRCHDLGLITWSPMAMGMLAGRYSNADDVPDDSRARLRGGIYAERVTARGVEVGNRFAALARAYGMEPAQLAVLWVKEQAGVTAPIIGPRTPAQLKTLLPLLEMTLDDDLRAACDELSPPGGVIASFFNSAPWMAQRFV